MARESDITILNHDDLRYLLLDTLKMYSEDVQYISGNNPYLININKKPFYILIKNLHDSGKGRVNADESRVQIAKTKNFLSVQNSGKPVLIFGYSKKDNTFTAWNPILFRDRINQRETVSLYSRFSIQKLAQEKGIAQYEDNNKQKIISFKPEYLGLYIENYLLMHQISEKALLKLIKESEDAEYTEDKGIKIKIERRKFTITHKKFKRDEKFRKIIYEVYENRCAVCGMQLELIEAAHIIPHSDDKGSDDPQNGVCLCALHHKAYDGGLIYFDEDYKIKLNDAKVEYLQKTKKDGGMMKFVKLQFDTLVLPTSKVFYPSVEYLKEANKIRGIINE